MALLFPEYDTGVPLEVAAATILLLMTAGTGGYITGWLFLDAI
jgi:hypothetical protein